MATADRVTKTSETLPLAGIRVLEFCHTIMGPTAGLILADLGADVKASSGLSQPRSRRWLSAALLR